MDYLEAFKIFIITLRYRIYSLDGPRLFTVFTKEDVTGECASTTMEFILLGNQRLCITQTQRQTIYTHSSQGETVPGAPS